MNVLIIGLIVIVVILLGLGLYSRYGTCCGERDPTSEECVTKSNWVFNIGRSECKSSYKSRYARAPRRIARKPQTVNKPHKIMLKLPQKPILMTQKPVPIDQPVPAQTAEQSKQQFIQDQITTLQNRIQSNLMLMNNSKGTDLQKLQDQVDADKKSVSKLTDILQPIIESVPVQPIIEPVPVQPVPVQPIIEPVPVQSVPLRQIMPVQVSPYKVAFAPHYRL
jgi:hypothetical protein